MTDSIPRKRQQDLQLILEDALYDDLDSVTCTNTIEKEKFESFQTAMAEHGKVLIRKVFELSSPLSNLKFKKRHRAQSSNIILKTILRCPHKSQMTWAMMGAYQIIAHALLLNLLIAVFTNTYTRINTGTS